MSGISLGDKGHVPSSICAVAQLYLGAVDGLCVTRGYRHRSPVPGLVVEKDSISTVFNLLAPGRCCSISGDLFP